MSETEAISIEKYTLVVGIGFFEQKLIDYLSQKRRVKVIDIRQSHAAKLREKHPDIDFIIGDSSSTVTWKKIQKEGITQVIITLRDQDIVTETCRIIREVLQLEVMIILLSYESFDESALDAYNVTVIRPIQLGLDIISSLLDKNVSWPVNIGNRQGEIVEVQVLKNSHLVGIKYKHIRPSNWSIALVYKDGKALIPNENTRINIGDRLLIVGEPKVVKGVVDTLYKGEPNFPLQFGQNVAVYCSSRHPELIDESIFFLKNTLARKLNIMPVIGKTVKGLADKMKNEEVDFFTGENIANYKDVADVKDGLVIVPKTRGLLSRWYYSHFFRNAASPLLFTDGYRVYDRMIISLNNETPSFTLETGVELAKLLRIPFKILYVTLPFDIQSQKDNEYLTFRKNIVADFELSEGVTLDYEIIEGNPVIETIKKAHSYADEKILLVTAFDPEDGIGFFKPNVQFMITKNVRVSVLAIPVEDTHA